MKALNYWKTLFCMLMAFVTFSACSDDDSDDGKYSGIPEVTVDGASSAVVAHDLAAGKTDAVTVVTKGSWVLTFDKAADAGWCTPSKMSGKTGTTELTFSLAKASAAREASLTLSVSGSVQGIVVTRKATIVVKQNEGGSTVPESNVAAIRTLLKAMNPTTTKTPVTDEIAAMKITGVVVSVFDGHNFGNDYNIAIQDADGAPNSGLTLNANAFATLAISAGSVVTANLTGAQVNLYNGVLQIALDNTSANIQKTPGTPLQPTVIAATDMLNYESQLVKIEDCQPATDAIGKAWSTDDNKGVVDFTAGTANTAFEVYTGKSATYRTDIVPNKKGSLVCIASQNSKGGKRALPRSAADFSGLNIDIPAPTYPLVTINNLAVGNYQVDATIVGVHSKGVLFADNAGGKNNYVLAFNNAWTTQTSNTFKDKLDYLANVKGAVKDQFGLLQFNAPEITTSTQAAFNLGTPVNFDAAAIEAYASAIQADQTASEYKYVKLTGVITIKAESGYNSYTLDIDGLSDNVVKTVTLAYGFDSYFANVQSGDVVDITGFALGFDTTKGNLNIMTRTVTKNTAITSLNITTTPTVFAAAGGTQTINFTIANLGTNKVFAKVTGTDATQFTLSTDDEISGTSITVTAKANEDATPKNAKLTLYVAAAKDGNAIDTDEVDLAQLAKPSGNSEVVTLDFTADSYGIPVKESASEATFTVGTYSFAYQNLKYYDSDKYVMFVAKSLDNCYITFPAIAGKKLMKVVATNNKGAAAGAAVTIVPKDNATPVAGGASQKWTAVAPATGASEITFDLTDTAVNTAYRVLAVKGANVQLTKLVLTYE